MANTKRISQEFLFAPDTSQVFIGMAFRGEFFYLLEQSGSKIVKYTRCFEYIEDIELDRSYSCICQGDENGGFWAASKACPNIIFYLDEDLKECREIHILPPKSACGYITGMSFNCRCKTILIAYTWGVIEVNPETEASSILYESNQGITNGVISIYPGSIMVKTVSGRQIVSVLNQYQQISHQQQIPTNFFLKQMVYCPSGEEPVLYCLMTQNSGKTKVVTSKFSYKALGFTIDSSYQDVCYYEKFMDTEKLADCHMCSFPQITLPNIWNEVNHKNCYQGRRSCPKAQIMESVALSGTAISHILNAEGEKLQKVIACSDDISEILCVNREVSRTIVHVTQLEQALYNKLLALEDQCCDSCSEQCNKCNDRCTNHYCCKCNNKCRECDNKCSEYDNKCCECDNKCCECVNKCGDDDNKYSEGSTRCCEIAE